MARLLQNDREIARAPLAYAGETSTYAGALTLPVAGSYTLQVLAMDPGRANFGRVEQAVEVAP